MVVDVEEIKWWLSQLFDTKGTVTVDAATGVIDVDGVVVLKDEDPITEIPVTFGKVAQSFYCNSNQLKSLKGAPHTVGHEFMCHNNQLVSLEGAPTSVGGNFWCHNNQLTDLKGSPQSVGDGFWCGHNPLVSLEGFPKDVGGTADLSYSAALPLLRTLNAQRIRLHYDGDDNYSTAADVLNHHAGQGRRGAIQAARELLQAGELLQKEQALDHNPFERNARW
jgi:hypothetical protein